MCKSNWEQVFKICRITRYGITRYGKTLNCFVESTSLNSLSETVKPNSMSLHKNIQITGGLFKEEYLMIVLGIMKTYLFKYTKNFITKK